MAQDGDGSQGNAPMPRRDPPIQGHWGADSKQAWQVQQEQGLMEGDNGDAEGDYDRTPRSIAEYSKVSSLPSAAPEFYEEEPVTLTRIEEVLATEHGLREACRTLPITMASWVFFTLLVFYHGQIQGSYDCAGAIRESILSIEVPAVNSSTTLRTLRLGTITERYDIVQWIRHGFVPSVTMPGLKHGQLRRTQQLLGKVRIAQTRSTPSPCGMNGALEGFYSGMCHPAGGDATAFGRDKYGHAPKLEFFMAFEPYNIGSAKNKFVAWLDISRPKPTLDTIFNAMLDYDWLDDNTQDVTIEAMFLNTEINVYSKMVVKFELHRGGWIQQEVIVDPMRGDVYYHWAIIWLDMMWVVIMMFLMWQALMHMIEEVHKGLFRWWITDFFVWVDIISVTMGAGIALFFWYISGRLDGFVTRVATLGPMPLNSAQNPQAVTKFKTRYILNNWEYEKDVQAIFDEFASVESLTTWFRLIAFWYNMVIVCRFYRGYTGQPRIAVILQTISQVAMFLLHYLILLVVVMANFTVAGYILFGQQLKDWSTLGKATCSAVLCLFGRFDYNEFHAVAPISAFLWFGSFFILVVLIITGLTTATILHHYLKVRTRTGQAGDSIVKQVFQMISEACYNRTYDGAQKSLPPDKLFEMVTLDTDPLRLRNLSRFTLERRMRTRHALHEAELDPRVDVEFLIERGMDPVTAERLLERIAESGHHIENRSAPVHRLSLFIARQMSSLRFSAEHMRNKTTAKVAWASKAMDRLDLKHAKSVSLAKRIRRAQELPVGWTSHTDDQGRRYLRQTETGLTSWTLPRHLI